MRNLANFALFQIGWFVCVVTAADGELWLGALVAAAIVAVHIAFVALPGRRGRELAFIVGVGAAGTLIDTGLASLGVTHYPASDAWSFAIAPPWIAALWFLFATLPHHSLAWLAGRTRLAIVLGAIGGPLSYLGGERMGAVATAENPWISLGGLAVEYAIVTPILLAISGKSRVRRAT